MNGYRTQSGNFVRGRSHRWTPQTRKPPTWIWQAVVSSWEKEFVSSVGCMSWKDFLEKKKYADIFVDINQYWDDLAGREAFKNAKERFWAKINNIPCDISLPDPDMYTDEVDWDAELDQELILDLERVPNVSDIELEEETGPKLIRFEDLLDPNVQVPCDGWGSVEDDPNTVGGNAHVAAAWLWKGNCSNENVWGSRQKNAWANSRQWNHEDRLNDRRDAAPGAGPIWYAPGYVTTFRGDYYQGSSGWENGRGQRRPNYLRRQNFQ